MPAKTNSTSTLPKVATTAIKASLDAIISHGFNRGDVFSVYTQPYWFNAPQKENIDESIFLSYIKDYFEISTGSECRSFRENSPKKFRPILSNSEEEISVSDFVFKIEVIAVTMKKEELKKRLLDSFTELNEEGKFHRSEAQIENMVESCTRDFLSLPEFAPELYRPIDPEKQRPVRRVNPKTGERETIVRFLERVWYDPWIKEGALTRSEFRRLDPQGEMAVRNFQRDSSLEWPEHLHLPTRTERVESDLKRADELSEQLKMASRIRSAQQRRKGQQGSER